MNTSILQGMRVVEVSAFVAAPLGGMTLAQLGADVIRIDGLRGGLDYRRWPVTQDNTSLFWSGLNKGKKSVALDITKPEGQELAMALITAGGDDAGLFLTNFPPRGWLSYEALKSRREDLIQLTIQGDRKGGSAVDYTVNPAIGLPMLTGSEDPQAVTNHVLPAWDLITGQMAAVGLLAAERKRRLTGQGQHIKLPLEDVALAVMGHLGFIAEAQLGHERERVGNYLYGAFGRDFVSSDGVRVMVVGLTLKQWQSLLVATELTESVQALSEHLGRNLNLEGERYLARHELAVLFAGWFAHQTFAEIERKFTDNSVCWSRYQSVQDMVAGLTASDDPHPMFRSVMQPGVGAVLMPSLPWEFSAFPRRDPEPAPVLGQHTEQILQDVLGMSSGEFGRLHDKGLVLASKVALAS